MSTKKPTEKVEKKTEPVVEGEATTPAAPKPKSASIKLEDLVPFKDHPYKVIENDSLTELTDSIAEHGILNPLLVRPLEGGEGKYEIISGHRRFRAAQRLGMKKVPCAVYSVDRDAATVMMVDSNCQRTELLPSEKAKAYRMKMDAIKRMPGRRPAENGAPLEPHSETGKSRDIIAAESGESHEQVRRYIRLTYLVPELLQFVDEGKIGMRPAVEMSYLPEETQRDVVDCIDERGGEVFPSHAQTRRIRQLAESGGVAYDEIAAIMDEPKPNQAEKVSIKRADLTKYFPPSYTPDQIIKSILDILETQRQREQQELQRKERKRDDGAR